VILAVDFVEYFCRFTFGFVSSTRICMYESTIQEHDESIAVVTASFMRVAFQSKIPGSLIAVFGQNLGL